MWLTSRFVRLLLLPSGSSSLCTRTAPISFFNLRSQERRRSAMRRIFKFLNKPKPKPESTNNPVVSETTV